MAVMVPVVPVLLGNNVWLMAVASASRAVPARNVVVMAVVVPAAPSTATAGLAKPVVVELALPNAHPAVLVKSAVVTAVVVHVPQAVAQATTATLVANVSWNVRRIVPVRYVVPMAAVVAVVRARLAKAAVRVPASPVVHRYAIWPMPRTVVRV